jgi:hypothetical protein
MVNPQKFPYKVIDRSLGMVARMPGTLGFRLLVGVACKFSVRCCKPERGQTI